MACIEARGLRRTYGSTVALDGVDLRVDDGRILGIVGPNGAGKTTALNAILGLTSCEGELSVLDGATPAPSATCSCVTSPSSRTSRCSRAG